MKKFRKFLLVPNTPCAYDYHMMTNLGVALSRHGHHFAVSPSTESEYLSKYFSYQPDIILAVNKTRPTDGRVKRDVIFLSWFQDVYPETSDSLYFETNDKLYLLGTAEQLGIHVDRSVVPVMALYTGINPDIYAQKTSDICDFSLCGGLPIDIQPPEQATLNGVFSKSNFASILYAKICFAISGRNFLGLNYDANVIGDCKKFVNSNYAPLTGTLDINYIYNHLTDFLKNKGELSSQVDRTILQLLDFTPDLLLRQFAKTEQIAKLRAISKLEHRSDDWMIMPLCSWMAQSYPRILERKVLISYAENVSKDIRVYGNNMDTHSFSSPYYSGVLMTDEALANVYANSAINLGNNTHGLGLHSRNLGVMAAGGYLLHHRSCNVRSGSLELEFQEGIHYDAYSNQDQFEEISSNSLGNISKRIKMGNEAKNYVKSKHTWDNRAQQILNDLHL